ncbi:soluble lytic murein transglycosylase [Methylohalomonas lacus]|uniref:Soluble lytic murein transglycosylase n=1 Tax=Methylohalomonas lacus TaxID=398773 RepID=A0AAE3HJ68_9GAMM|nr:transglycosylase SLT domain-containing protein [Methylohalomonas lacus]MCS3903351.1 soluble lytic murein transglycosylase [Methylohalomonas lacus]
MPAIGIVLSHFRPSTGQPSRRLLTLLVLLGGLLCLPLPAAADREQQRADFEAARKALANGQLERYRQLAAGLEDYPLYPYLRYAYIDKRLRSLDNAEVAEFLRKHGDLPVADRLRNRWLDILTSRGQWQTYLDHYKQPNDNRLRCLYLTARMKTGQTDGLMDDIIRMWRVGYSQDEACDPAFEKLEASPQMTGQLVWERIRLAMANNKTGLVRYLAKKLSSDERQVAERWIEIHNNPDAGTRDPQLADTVIGREAVLYGLRRLLRRDIDKALDRWSALQQRYAFTPAEKNALQRDLAVRAADQEHADARQLLEQVADSEVDATVFLYRLRQAINNDDWQQLRAWTDGTPPDDVHENQWQYWRARALEKTGDKQAARDRYHELASQRDFYSFLAADRLGIDYRMNHYPLPISDEELAQIAERPGIQRAFEFLALDEEYAARREWHHILGALSPREMQGAAQLAAQRGWHNQAILAMGRAQAYDDLEVRFPVLYRETLARHASKHDLDLAWVYGLIRSESAFYESARSPAGALGLMQVMPRTGIQTAGKLGMKNFSSNQLLKADYNIPIGNRYLKEVYDNFNGNMILATAAYNAGPHRVKSWLPDSGCIEPDIWIENIPFRETRGYVKRVLEYASVYDWRLEREQRRVTARMDAVKPVHKPDSLLASLQCNFSALTMQP